MTYTPGPWEYSNDLTRNSGTSGWSVGPIAHQVAEVDSEDNARLIAAAPELLAALRDIEATVHEPCAVNQDRQQWAMRRLNEVLYTARAAIAKATGANQ